MPEPLLNHLNIDREPLFGRCVCTRELLLDRIARNRESLFDRCPCMREPLFDRLYESGAPARPMSVCAVTAVQPPRCVALSV